MILSDEMADYQQPPMIANQPMKKLAESLDMEKLKKRIELYRQRQKDSALNNQATSQVEYQQSQERTQIYHEKWQQVKAKKSNKRQRDSSSMTAGQMKRKLPTNKTDGPPNKQSNTESSGAKEEVNDTEDLLLFDLGIDEQFTDNNLKDIMTILEESESSNASAQDCVDKTSASSLDQRKPVNGMYTSPMHHQQPLPSTTSQPSQPASNTRPQHQTLLQQAQQPGQQQLGMSSTPSPQLQHNGGVAPPQQSVPPYMGPIPGHPASTQMSTIQSLYPQVVKSERTASGVPVHYSRSMSESASAMAIRQQQQMQQMQHPQHMDRQSSMPAEYSRTYPAEAYSMSTKRLPSQMIAGLPQGVSMGPEYVRQMSNPTGQAGGAPVAYYHGQMPGVPVREHPHAGQVPAYHGYPSTSGHYSHHSQPMTVEEVRRLENIKNLEAMQKIQLPRSSAHTAAPGQWMTQNGGYYPMMAGEHSAAAAMHHQAALRANPMHQQHLGHQMHPSAASSQYMVAQQQQQQRPGYSVPMATSASVTSPMMSRQMSNHAHTAAMSHEQQQNSLTSKAASMQQLPAAALTRPVYPASQQPASMPSGPPYHPATAAAHLRGMSTTNPAAAAAMMSHHQSASLPQRHLSRSQSVTNAQGQNPMLNAGHPSVHPHALHRPSSAGLHQQTPQQMIPHTTSPPHPQQSLAPQSQSHYINSQPQPHPTMPHQPQPLPHQRTTAPQIQQHSMQHQHMNNVQQQQQQQQQSQQASMALAPQHVQPTQLPQAQSPDQQQLHEDLKDLEQILSGS